MRYINYSEVTLVLDAKIHVIVQRRLATILFMHQEAYIHPTPVTIIFLEGPRIVG
jgi:hypothetical protein